MCLLWLLWGLVAMVLVVLVLVVLLVLLVGLDLSLLVLYLSLIFVVTRWIVSSLQPLSLHHLPVPLSSALTPACSDGRGC